MPIGSHLVLARPFMPDRIQVVHEPRSNRAVDPAIEARIEAEWQRQLDVARQRGLVLYESVAYRLNTFAVANERLALHLAPMPYRVHAAMKALYRLPGVTEEHFDKALVVDALIRTRDEHVVFAQVEKVVEEPVSLIGGTCSRSRVPIETTADLFAYTAERVRSVLRVAGEQVAIPCLLGLVQNEIGYIHAVFDVRLALRHDEVMHAFTPGYGKTALVTIPASDIAAYLAASRGYVHALAPLLARPN